MWRLTPYRLWLVNHYLAIVFCTQEQNVMDLNVDSCVNRLTDGQVERLVSQLTDYRVAE